MVVCKLIDIIHLKTVKGCHMIDLMWNYPSPVHKKQLAASHNYIDIYEVDNRQPIALLLLFNHPHPCASIGRITNRGAQSCHLFYNYFLLNRFLLPN